VPVDPHSRAARPAYFLLQRRTGDRSARSSRDTDAAITLAQRSGIDMPVLDNALTPKARAEYSSFAGNRTRVHFPFAFAILGHM